jgi:hypothetical protein
MDPKWKKKSVTMSITDLEPTEDIGAGGSVAFMYGFRLIRALLGLFVSASAFLLLLFP